MHAASAVPAAVQELSSDFLTLRYYGRYGERFSLAQLFPTEVCSMYPATCADLRLWECIQSPPDMRVPYSNRATLFLLDSSRTLDPPRESARGSYLLLARSRLTNEGQHLVLWSGCNESCGDCLRGTGNVMILQELNMCLSATEGGVFEMRYNDGQHGDTHQQCWESLAAYDREAERQARVHTIIKYTAFGTVAIVGCTIGVLILCYRCHCKPRQEEVWQGNVDPTGRPRISPTRMFDKADIDRLFPPTTSESEAMCCVCLVNIERDEPCRRLQCNHEFHADCISSWWTHIPRASLECPLCKRKQEVDVGSLREATESPSMPDPGMEGRADAVILDLASSSPPPSTFPAVPRGAGGDVGGESDGSDLSSEGSSSEAGTSEGSPSVEGDEQAPSGTQRPAPSSELGPASARPHAADRRLAPRVRTVEAV